MMNVNFLNTFLLLVPTLITLPLLFGIDTDDRRSKIETYRDFLRHRLQRAEYLVQLSMLAEERGKIYSELKVSFSPTVEFAQRNIGNIKQIVDLIDHQDEQTAALLGITLATLKNEFTQIEIWIDGMEQVPEKPDFKLSEELKKKYADELKEKHKSEF
ncbi:hypothetical protein Ddc_10073 [Ditylenchus destructor]|nr:hypothetical protein Ddc_10073 [Ditylenchus destructor]